MVQDAELARDVVQEAFLRAYRALPRFRALLTVALINCLTNPALNFTLLLAWRFTPYEQLPGGAAGPILLGEAVVVLVEWRLLLWVLGGPSRRMLLVSLALNAASAPRACCSGCSDRCASAPRRIPVTWTTFPTARGGVRRHGARSPAW